MAEAPDDGEAQQHEAESGDDHGGSVEGDGEGVELHLEQVGGEEGEEREAEEEEEIGVEDGLVSLFGAVDEVVVVDPVDGGEGEGQSVDGEGGEDGTEPGQTGLVWGFELEHHDGDDDGDDSVGEGFEAGWGAGEVRHGDWAAFSAAYNGWPQSARRAARPSV